MWRVWRSAAVHTCVLAAAMLGVAWLFAIALSAVMPLLMALPLWVLGAMAAMTIGGALWILR